MDSASSMSTAFNGNNRNDNAQTVENLPDSQKTEKLKRHKTIEHFMITTGNQIHLNNERDPNEQLVDYSRCFGHIMLPDKTTLYYVVPANTPIMHGLMQVNVNKNYKQAVDTYKQYICDFYDTAKQKTQSNEVKGYIEVFNATIKTVSECLQTDISSLDFNGKISVFEDLIDLLCESLFYFYETFRKNPDADHQVLELIYHLVCQHIPWFFAIGQFWARDVFEDHPEQTNNDALYFVISFIARHMEKRGVLCYENNRYQMPVFEPFPEYLFESSTVHFSRKFIRSADRVIYNLFPISPKSTENKKSSAYKVFKMYQLEECKIADKHSRGDKETTLDIGSVLLPSQSDYEPVQLLSDEIDRNEDGSYSKNKKVTAKRQSNYLVINADKKKSRTESGAQHFANKDTEFEEVDFSKNKSVSVNDCKSTKSGQQTICENAESKKIEELDQTETDLIADRNVQHGNGSMEPENTSENMSNANESSTLPTTVLALPLPANLLQLSASLNALNTQLHTPFESQISSNLPSSALSSSLLMQPPFSVTSGLSPTIAALQQQPGSLLLPGWNGMIPQHQQQQAIGFPQFQYQPTFLSPINNFMGTMSTWGAQEAQVQIPFSYYQSVCSFLQLPPYLQSYVRRQNLFDMLHGQPAAHLSFDPFLHCTIFITNLSPLANEASIAKEFEQFGVEKVDLLYTSEVEHQYAKMYEDAVKKGITPPQLPTHSNRAILRFKSKEGTRNAHRFVCQGSSTSVGNSAKAQPYDPNRSPKHHKPIRNLSHCTN